MARSDGKKYEDWVEKKNHKLRCGKEEKMSGTKFSFMRGEVKEKSPQKPHKNKRRVGGRVKKTDRHRKTKRQMRG